MVSMKLLSLLFVQFIINIFLSHNAIGSLCGTCSGHGSCSSLNGRCTCYPGYTGYQCEHFSCPMGTAWTDYATATDTAHAEVECSNMGLCDRNTGLCTCRTGFEGVACERMSCPPCINGRCISMREAATLKDDRNFFYSTTYTAWDADKIYGCLCDYSFTGHKCSLRECPKGDDPGTTTSTNVEIQHISCLCDGCSGTFSLSFRGETTKNLSPTSTAANIKDALDALRGIWGVTVTISNGGSTVCDTDGQVASVTFTNNPGDLPAMIVSSSLTGGTSNIVIAAGASSAAYDSVGTATNGNKEELECSRRGSCSTSTGVCTCDTNFKSSNGAGASGDHGDCGYTDSAITACPTTSVGVCNLHGTCSESSTWYCTCDSGWSGHDCSKRDCPTGKAWFDEATAANTAHALTECSNKGVCDKATGTCTCDTGFSGSACETLSCPGTTECNGHGECKTMQELALVSASNGVLLGVTYGNTANLAATWDYNKLQGCHCSIGYYMGPYVGSISAYQAYDCSLLSCPYGDDPIVTGGVNEVQTITCDADGGTFTLTFREKTTASISYAATAATVKAALEALSTITTVTVTFSSGVAVCASGGITTSVTFIYEQGALPPLSYTSSLTKTASTATVTIGQTTGTKANLECSNRGDCNRVTGTCECYDGFASSDGDGGAGSRGDCGYKSGYSTISTD